MPFGVNELCCQILFSKRRKRSLEKRQRKRQLTGHRANKKGDLEATFIRSEKNEGEGRIERERAEFADDLVQAELAGNNCLEEINFQAAFSSSSDYHRTQTKHSALQKLARAVFAALHQEQLHGEAVLELPCCCEELFSQES